MQKIDQAAEKKKAGKYFKRFFFMLLMTPVVLSIAPGAIKVGYEYYKNRDAIKAVHTFYDGDMQELLQDDRGFIGSLFGRIRVIR